MSPVRNLLLGVVQFPKSLGPPSPRGSSKIVANKAFSIDVVPARYGTHPEPMYDVQMMRRPKNTCSRRHNYTIENIIDTSEANY